MVTLRWRHSEPWRGVRKLRYVSSARETKEDFHYLLSPRLRRSFSITVNSGSWFREGIHPKVSDICILEKGRLYSTPLTRQNLLTTKKLIYREYKKDYFTNNNIF